MKEKLDLIEKLFSWNRETLILDSKSKQIGKVYQRLCGDADIQKARTTSLRYSRELRIKLKDENSDEYLAYVDGYKDLNKDDLINLILFDELINIRNKIEKEFNFPEPREPKEDATTEQWEEYQVLQDSYEERRTDALNKVLTEELDSQRNKLSSLEIEILQNRVIISKINSLCENELRIKFMEMVTHLGTYRDKKFKNKVFNNFHDFLDAPDILKNQLLEGYTSLELSSINLKGLQEIQPSDQKSDLVQN